MRHAAQTVEQAPVNSALLNVVTPMGLSFEREPSFHWGEYRKGIRNYPLPAESGCGMAF